MKNITNISGNPVFSRDWRLRYYHGWTRLPARKALCLQLPTLPSWGISVFWPVADAVYTLLSAHGELLIRAFGQQFYAFFEAPGILK